MFTTPSPASLDGQQISSNPSSVADRLTSLGVGSLHGTASGSLFDVLKTGLVPTGEQSQVSFTGEMMGGILGLNKSQVSVVGLAAHEVALSYADRNLLGWEPSRSEQLVELAEGWMREGGASKEDIEKWRPVRNSIEQARKDRWEELTHQERSWVSNPFPVVFGISSQVVPQATFTSVVGELSVGDAKPAQITVFVPEDRIAEVREAVITYDSPCRVEALSILKIF